MDPRLEQYKKQTKNILKIPKKSEKFNSTKSNNWAKSSNTDC